MNSPSIQQKLAIGRPIVVVYNPCGGENGPVTVAAFKAADSALRGSNGGFDSHTPPPYLIHSWTLDLCPREHEGTLRPFHVPVGSKSRTSLLFAFRRRSGTALV